MSKQAPASLILKASIFATGLAGIVAEYVLSTLATYLLGDAVFQWTIVMSLMLFAMGLGSRFSKYFRENLLDIFILVEFTLSLICAGASVAAYGLAAYTAHVNLIIYSLAICIGILIGFEIPLVTRINEDYEELRANIANIMEKDYYGALVGGLLFAFLALPHLGLTYTPIALGTVNFLVALIFLMRFRHLLRFRQAIQYTAALCAIALGVLAINAEPVILFGEQSQYKDKIVYSQQTPYQKIVMTQWRGNYWLFINGQEQFSSYDEEMYHEPLVHPAMLLAGDNDNILLLGGGDGLAFREIIKHPDVKKVTMVDLDPAMTTLAKTHPVLTKINQHSMDDPRLTIVNTDAAAFLRDSNELYSVIIIDLPDPDTVDLMHLYSRDFYQLVNRHLKANGIVVTQATSPYFSPLAFLCINKTMQAAGLTTLPYHNQVPTMGEWGWILATKSRHLTRDDLLHRFKTAPITPIKTRFLNKETMQAMPNFGKGIFDHPKAKDITINTKSHPVLIRYYSDGKWAMY